MTMPMKVVLSFRLLIIPLLTLLPMIQSCSMSGESKEEFLPGIEIPLSEMNTKVRLEIYPGMPDVFTKDEDLLFLIYNNSSNAIIFPKDFGVNVLIQQGDKWSLLTNNWGYPEGTNTLFPNDVYPGGLSFYVFPDMSGISDPVTVRIVVIGNEIDSNDLVAAFIDVKYEP